MEKLKLKLVSWIKEQVEAASAEGVVFGLSGGVDSSTVAVLCKQAFPQNSLGVLMSCHSSPEDFEDARLIAGQFNIKVEEIALDGIYDVLAEKLGQSQFGTGASQVSLGNIKPRLRMTALYFFANTLNYLVVGTGNKSEAEVGYFTKYGDGGVDILPLGNLLKTQVKKLALHLGIPQKIVDKVPSAGLWEGQTDEGELGLTYEQLDSYLLGKDVGLVGQKIEEMRKRSFHKRRPPAVPDF